jgi:hypothetical protein
MVEICGPRSMFHGHPGEEIRMFGSAISSLGEQDDRVSSRRDLDPARLARAVAELVVWNR